MTVDEPASPDPERALAPAGDVPVVTTDRASWRVIAAGVLILALASGWFAMSVAVMGSSVSDAFGEAIGVGFGFLLAFSVLGAVLNTRAKQALRPDPPDGES